MDIDGLNDLLSMNLEQLDLERRQALLGMYKGDIESALCRLVDGFWHNTYNQEFIDSLTEDALVTLTLINYAMDPKDMKRHKEWRFFFDNNAREYHLMCVEDFEGAETLPGRCWFSQEEADQLGKTLVHGQVEFCMCHLNMDSETLMKNHRHTIETGDDIFG